jgi:hypothetical protein
MANLVFRLPGKEMYSYVEVTFDSDLRDLDGDSVAEELKTALAALNAAFPESARPIVAATVASPVQSASPASGRTCSHGEMKLREGKSAKGNWAAYMCPERDRANQCKPVDAVTGKAWA